MVQALDVLVDVQDLLDVLVLPVAVDGVVYDNAVDGVIFVGCDQLIFQLVAIDFSEVI